MKFILFKKLNSNGHTDAYQNQVEVESESEFSDEIKEIVRRKPSWLLRWGVTSVVTFIVALVALSFFIKYPEIVDAPITLTTDPPPINIIARSSGSLMLLVKDNQQVKEGECVAVIENPSNYQDILYLSDMIPGVRRLVFENRLEEIEIRNNLDVGEIEGSYLGFLQSLYRYENAKKRNHFEGQISSLKAQTTLFTNLSSELKLQEKICLEDLELEHKKFRQDSILFFQNVIAEVDYNKSKSSLLLKQKALKDSKTNSINCNIRIAESLGRINQLRSEQENENQTLINEIRNAFKILDSEFQKWKQQYLIFTPATGKITLFKYWNNHQYITTGDELLTVTPPSDSIFGKVLLPVSSSSKLEINQKVIIRLVQYPYDEFGTVDGIVKSVSNLPKDNNYSIIISLPKGLQTSHNIKLDFKQEMQGNARLVKKDLTLIENIFKRIRLSLER